MDALVRFYEREWACLAKAEYYLRSAVVDIGFAVFQGRSRMRGNDDSAWERRLCVGMTARR